MHIVQFGVMQQHKVTLQDLTGMNAPVIIPYIFADLPHAARPPSNPHLCVQAAEHEEPAGHWLCKHRSKGESARLKYQAL